MDSSTTSSSTYRQQQPSQHQFYHAQSLSDIPGRRQTAPSYDHGLSLFSSSEGYSLPFLDNSSQNLGFLPYQPIASSMIQAPTSVSSTMTMTQNMPYSGMSIRAGDHPSHLKGAAWTPRQDSSGILPPVEHSQIQIQGNTKTDVDTLMKAIQQKHTSPTHAYFPSSVQSPPTRSAGQSALTIAPKESGSPQGSRTRKKYQCHLSSCAKRFFQKTHLEIHMRAHTGYKPFLCREPSCGQRFSQLGNLKTHERRHTGERPYSCNICGKRFAQRGNVRAHRVVHEQTKPFVCKLEKCGKHFTQLGNLKSHQNKFHSHVLQDLTAKFASIKDGDEVPAVDKDLWEYFSELYKNSNKGIKGRGKGRKITAMPHSTGPKMERTGTGSEPNSRQAVTGGQSEEDDSSEESEDEEEENEMGFNADRRTYYR